MSPNSVVFAVGVLKEEKLGHRIRVFAENKYIKESKETFTENVEAMLKIADSICGRYPWDIYNICVLPPSISDLKIECPCVAFVSPFLLSGDFSLISPIAQNIANNWAGSIVTCVNFNHLWLHKSFSLYIFRNIIREIEPKMKQFLEKKGFDNLGTMEFITNQLPESLVPNMAGVVPDTIIQNVPYEAGYLLLNHIEHLLGESVFKQYLQSYLSYYAFKSLTSNDWAQHLYSHFPDKLQLLQSIKIYDWYYSKILLTNDLSITTTSTLEEVYKDFAKKKRINWNYSLDVPLIFLDLHSFLEIQKIEFLNLLYNLNETLIIDKLIVMPKLYEFDNNKNYEIRLAWLRLCTKFRWQKEGARCIEIRYTIFLIELYMVHI